MGTHNQKITPMVNTKWEATKKHHTNLYLFHIDISCNII